MYLKPGQKWCLPCVIQDSQFTVGTETDEDKQMTEYKETSTHQHFYKSTPSVHDVKVDSMKESLSAAFSPQSQLWEMLMF